jgi:lysophospholipase L1-like esterase
VIQFTPACAQYDRELGYTLKPGSCTFSGVEFNNVYRINSLGVRDDEKSLDHPEIVVAGDSVAMGWGVNQEETFAKLLEKKTQRTVLNAAVSSYGTAREMMILQRLPTDRLQTLIIQYSGNDYDENRDFYLHNNMLPTMSAEDYRHYTAINTLPNDYYFGKNLRLKLEKIIAERKSKKQEQRKESKPLDKDDVDLFLNAVSHSGINVGNVRIITFIVNGRDPADNREFTQALKRKISLGNYPPSIKNMTILDTATILQVDRFYVLDDHPNRSGHEALATALLGAVGKL